MDTNENVKKKGFTKVLILFAILIVITLIIGFAYARYITMLQGGTTADVAKWSFNYKILETTQREEVTNFAVTRTDDNQEVQDYTIAPGTSGEFIIEINATGTETLLTYNVNIGLENKPTNLKFYSNSSKTEEIEVENNTLIFNRFYVFNR